jgi:xylan 1,4-beta-xylosidase
MHMGKGVCMLLYLVACACLVASSDSLHGDEPVEIASTFCNPLSLPNYPIGRFARDLSGGDQGPDWMWRLDRKQQFRELADVTALWFDDMWYLYPSVDMAWVSADRGATWQHHPLNVRDIGYAPTIVRHKGKFLLMGSDSPIYASEHPLGPFEAVGKIDLQRTGKMPGFIDPMLFSDDDERLYYYWGCSPTGGIWGVELDADNLTQVISSPKELIPFAPEKFPWEAVGNWNQNPRIGWMEGAWMLKRGGKYYLTYCAGGTENRTYAMGCYRGDSPLGPFEPQKRNPILRSVDGLVTGTAHGSIVAGPNDELWAFYSVKASVVHAFERQLGMDRAGIDSDGELFVQGATSLPQWLPTETNQGASSHASGWLPLNGELRTIGSSSAPNLEGRFAVDNDLRTWWQPSDSDRSPSLTTSFMAPSTVRAIRIAWRDIGLDTQRGVLPGPIRYRVELEVAAGQWETILDRSQSQVDLMTDYRECIPSEGSRARLTILDWPQGLVPAVAEFTLFGNTN